jgi:hypothetical protein
MERHVSLTCLHTHKNRWNNWNKISIETFLLLKNQLGEHTSKFKNPYAGEYGELKYLGTWLDETISFETHILRLIPKINPCTYVLLRLKRLITPVRFPQVLCEIVMSNLKCGI